MATSLRSYVSRRMRKSHAADARIVELLDNRIMRFVIPQLSLRSVRAHFVRFLLTATAVVLGVAFMSGTMILTDTMSASFDRVFETANAGVDVIVQHPVDGDDPTLDHPRLPAAALDRVREVPGVATVEGTVQGFAQLAREHKTAAMSITLGMNWITEPKLNPLELSDGRAPKDSREVVVDLATAEREGWEVGDQVTIVAEDGPQPFALVGLATFGDLAGVPGASLVATDTQTAQRLFGEPGAFDALVVAGDGSIQPDQLVHDIRGVLDDQSIEVVSGRDDTADKQSDLHEDLRFFNAFLLAFAAVALFVGVFIIYNTFTIVLAQRSRELATLRLLGASRPQVLQSVLLEAGIIGVASSGIGLVLGVFTSRALRAVLVSAGLPLPAGPTVISSATVITAAVVGLTVTLGSTIVPALRARRIAPLAAMREAEVDRSGTSRVRAFFGLLSIAGGAVLIATGLQQSGTQAMRLAGLGTLASIVGVLASAPIISRPVVRVLAAPAHAVSSTIGRLASDNARRNPNRTAATATALMIGVTLVGFITILASSASQAVGDSVDRSFRADYVIDSGALPGAGFSTGLASDVRALPDVAAVSPRRTTTVSIAGGSTGISAVDASVFERLYDVEPVEGRISDLAAGDVAVESTVAAAQGLRVGDAVTVTFGRTGDVSLTVRAIFDQSLEGMAGNDWIVDLQTFESNVTRQYDQQLYVATRDGVDTDAARQAIDAAVGDWPGAEVQDQAQYKQAITDETDKVLNLVYALLALAIVIAVLGIANTLALSVHERTREIGLLRAIGMTRVQVRATVRWESLIIALFGTGLGLVLAVGSAWTVVRASAAEDLGALSVPFQRLVVIAVVAAMAGVAASLAPARRAARMDVLAAIAAP
jgi:putative ABC transport system permease protein